MKSYGPARGMKRRHFLLTAGAFTTALVLPSCTSSSQNPVPGSSGTPSLSLKVGVSPVPHGEILTYVKDQLAAKAGLTIEIVEFSDYVQPNLALNDRKSMQITSSMCLIWKISVKSAISTWWLSFLFTLSRWDYTLAA